MGKKGKPRPQDRQGPEGKFASAIKLRPAGRNAAMVPGIQEPEKEVQLHPEEGYLVRKRAGMMGLFL